MPRDISLWDSKCWNGGQKWVNGSRIFHRGTVCRGTVRHKKKMFVSVRLGSVRFFFLTVNCHTAKCPTAKNPRTVFMTALTNHEAM